MQINDTIQTEFFFFRWYSEIFFILGLLWMMKSMLRLLLFRVLIHSSWKWLKVDFSPKDKWNVFILPSLCSSLYQMNNICWTNPYAMVVWRCAGVSHSLKSLIWLLSHCNSRILLNKIVLITQITSITTYSRKWGSVCAEEMKWIIFKKKKMCRYHFS